MLIRSVQEDTFHHKYFTKPPLHFITCFFLDSSLETEYRRTAWRANYSVSGEYEAEPTLASSSFNAYIDILVSVILFLVVSLTCLLKYGLSSAWVWVCSLAGLYYTALVLVCCQQAISPGPASSVLRAVYNWCRAWLPSQVFGAVLLALPVISLYTNLSFENLDIGENSNRNFFMNLLVVCLIYFCNFTQVNCTIYFKISFYIFLFTTDLLLRQICPRDSLCHNLPNLDDNPPTRSLSTKFSGQ